MGVKKKILETLGECVFAWNIRVLDMIAEQVQDQAKQFYFSLPVKSVGLRLDHAMPEFGLVEKFGCLQKSVSHCFENCSIAQQPFHFNFYVKFFDNLAALLSF